MQQTDQTLARAMDDALNFMTRYGTVYYEILKLSNVIEDTSIPTAQVGLVGGSPQIYINPDFFTPLDNKQRAFVLLHEFHHLLHDHLNRLKYETSYKMTTLNVAADLAINPRTLRLSGFVRDDIHPPNMRYCWVDTIFTPKQIKTYNIKEDGSVDYYLQLLKKCNIISVEPDVMLVDCHGSKSVESDGSVKDLIESVVSEALKDPNVTIEDLENIEEFLGECDIDGSSPGATSNLRKKIIDAKVTLRHKDWDKIVKVQLKRIVAENKAANLPITKWDRPSMIHYLLKNRGTILPRKVYPKKPKYDKEQVFVFLDVSGSCLGYASRFRDELFSIPKERFDVRCWVFDTKAVEVSEHELIREMLYGGGTSFSCIKDVVESQDVHPDHVFVYTDGWAYSIKVDQPERWVWFITPDGTCDPVKRCGGKYIFLS